MNEAQTRPLSPGPKSLGGVTLKDVATAAGVSVSTASRALANNPRVSLSTRRHVQQVARDLNYVVNGLAQSMMGIGTQTVGFVTGAFLAESFARIAHGVDEVVTREHAMLMMNSTHNNADAERAVIDMLARQRTAGVLLVGTRTDQDHQVLADYRSMLAAVNARLVLCGSPAIPELDDIPSVSYDHYSGMVDATTALLEAGHRRIAFLGYEDRSTARERYNGYHDALHHAGIDVDPRCELVQHCDNISEQLLPAARRLLTLDVNRRPTAIVCVTDFAAHSVYRVACELGLRLPDDLSVTGFDDLSTDGTLTPTLSSVSVPFEEVGRYAASLMLGLPVDQGTHRVFPVRFIPRESIAPPRPSR